MFLRRWRRWMSGGSRQAIPSPRVVVQFVIGGAQKSGTTALEVHLRTHPEIGMASCKEVHFFDHDQYFTGGTPDYDHYHSFFESGEARRVVGEATPAYMYWQDAPRRIWEYNPSMKWITILRNPIERAYSGWNMERNRQREELPFWDALQCERERCRAALPSQHKTFSYVDRGFYTEQLRRIWRYFPEQQVLVLRHEQFRSDPAETLARVCDFLGVNRLEQVERRSDNTASYESAMGGRERDYLRRVFEGEIRSLEQMLGWDCSDWLAD